MIRARRPFWLALFVVLALGTASLGARQPFNAQIQQALITLGLWPYGVYADGECVGWDATASQYVPTVCAGGGGGGAPTNATYITQTPNASLSAEQPLNALSSGIMRVATTTGVVTSLTDSAGIAANISDETGSGALVFGTSPALTTPNLGTPSAVTLTNGTGLPISGIASLGANVASFLAAALDSAIATFLGTPSSANLASAVTGETGTGALVFATSPTLVTPALGTPASGVLTNATGLPLATGVSGQLPLANGGTGANLTDPGADRIGFWDDSAGAFTWLAAGSGLTITDTTISASSGSLTAADIAAGTFPGAAYTFTGTADATQFSAATGATNGYYFDGFSGTRFFRSDIGFDAPSIGLAHVATNRSIGLSFGSPTLTVTSSLTPDSGRSGIMYLSGDADGQAYTLAATSYSAGIWWQWGVTQTQTSNSTSIAPESGATLYDAGVSCATFTATAIGSYAKIVQIVTDASATVYTVVDNVGFTCTP